MFRGALGLLLPDIPPVSRLPAGFAEPPRPFVLRAAALDGRMFQPGAGFWVDIHIFDRIFDRSGGLRETLVRALGELEQRGLGPGRARVSLIPPVEPEEIEIELAEKIPQSRVTVNFVTPTELKGMTEGLEELPFRVLFARARDRVSALATQYGEGPLAMDFSGMARRAEKIRMVECSLRRREVMRQSSRTGQTHGIGGFTGFVKYEGDLSEFMPFLRAGWWTGVGRHTVWGNGVISCE